MALLQRCCFWFSLRLGGVIVGICSVAQATIWMMVILISIGNQTELSDVLHELAENLSITNKSFLKLAADPKPLLIPLVVYFSGFLLSSVLLIVGSVRCNYILLYPFLIADAIYTALMLFLDVLVMLNFRSTESSLGSLILYNNIGVFFILILIYMWTCVLSLLQIINELKDDVKQRLDLKIRRRKQESLFNLN